MRLLNFIRAHQLCGVVIVSGDSHWAGAFEYPDYGIWEFTASPFQAFPDLWGPSFSQQGSNSEFMRFFSAGSFHFGSGVLQYPNSSHRISASPDLKISLYSYLLDGEHPTEIWNRTLLSPDRCPGTS